MKIEVGKYYKTAKGKTAYVETFGGGKDGYHVDHGNGVYIWHFESGKSNLSPSLTDYDLLVEWEQEPKVDYNNGMWHGWNGGECPVHNETLVEYITRGELGKDYNEYECPAAELDWVCDSGNGDIFAFRVAKPYVEPKEPREWDVVVTEDGNLMITYMPETHRKQGREVIKVREVFEQ